MAPARPASAADEGSPEVLEVRCAGCGETLEVEPGLTEFICPGCATPQSLPPELMPPPPPRRRALPLPRGAADVRGARLPCGACGALLSVPVGLARCACPICGAELAVDTARLRYYLLSSAAVEGAVPVVPIGTSSAPPILQAREGASFAMQVQQEHPNFETHSGLIRAEPNNQLDCVEQVHTKRPNQLISEQAEPDHPDYMIYGEEVHEVNEVIARHNKQRNGYSVGPGIISVEKRQEKPLNQVWHQAQDQCSSYPFHSRQTHLEQPDRVIEAEPHSITSTGFREPGCIAPIKETTATRINCSTGRSIAPQTINVEKRQPQTHNQITQQAQKQPSCYAICPEHAQAEHADGVTHVQEKQREPVNQANHTEDAYSQLVDETIAGDNNRRRVRCSAGPSATGAEKRQVQTANEAIKQVQKQQSDSVIHMELENQVIHVEKEQSEPFNCRTRKRKKKGLIAASNSDLQLRRSKRLAKDSPAAIDKEPDKNEFLELQASPNGQVSAAVIDIGPIHKETVESQATSSTDHMPAAITDSEPTESEPDEQYAASPAQSLSDSPDIDRIIKNLCPSSSPRHEMPQTSSNKLDNLHLTTPPSSSHLDMSDPEHFARNYVPLEVRKALAKLRSNSLFEHTMSQASSGEACLHDLTDSEGDDPWMLTRQNLGTKRNLGRGRGVTLCLKVWTLPKGVRLPVQLNTSGEPVGKEAGTLTNFLGTIARDGILAPLAHQDWRRVPEKNKDVMCCIVKLKFDIAPVGELWILKCLGKKWKSWKALLKQKHYDAHETEEERLADRNPRVLEEQWRFLVAYWSTEKAKAASARNKACRAKVTATHTAGTKSFARIIEEERQKRPNKDEPTRADVFILTHTPKNGKPMKNATADIISRLREQSHKQTEDSGSDSTVHNFGLESRPNGPWGKAALKLKASFKEAMEAKRRAEDEAATLRKKMVEMEESQKKMQEDLANMTSTASAIHKTMPSGNLQNKHMHNMMPVSDFPDELTGEPSLPPGFPQNPHSSSSMPGPKRTKLS